MSCHFKNAHEIRDGSAFRELYQMFDDFGMTPSAGQLAKIECWLDDEFEGIREGWCEASYDSGFDNGHDAGVEAGHSDGYKDGWDACVVEYGIIEDEKEG